MHKPYLFALLFSFYGFSQSFNSKDSIANTSFVSNTDTKIVYRGIQNSIKIIVPDAAYFSATGVGLQKKSESGDYRLSPGAGKEAKIIIDITLKDGSKLKEEQFFKILNIPRTIAKINGQSCVKCLFEFSKKEIENIIIEIDIPGFFNQINLESFLNVESFMLNLPKKNILITGNKLNDISIAEIKKLKKGTIIYLSDIRQSNPYNVCFFNNFTDYKIILTD